MQFLQHILVMKLYITKYTRPTDCRSLVFIMQFDIALHTTLRFSKNRFMIFNVQGERKFVKSMRRDFCIKTYYDNRVNQICIRLADCTQNIFGIFFQCWYVQLHIGLGFNRLIFLFTKSTNMLVMCGDLFFVESARMPDFQRTIH